MVEEVKKTNIWAILGLIFAFLFPLLGLIFSLIALKQIKNNPKQGGKGIAIAGLIISIIYLVIIILIAILALSYFGVFNPRVYRP